MSLRWLRATVIIGLNLKNMIALVRIILHIIIIMIIWLTKEMRCLYAIKTVGGS